MSRTRTNSRPDPRRRGAILIAAIVVLVAMAGMVLVLGRNMSIEAYASANQAAALQASAVERGGEQYVLAVLSDKTQSPMDLPEQDFQAVPVGDGYFWVLRPDYADNSLPLFGIVDENSKLDLNYATRDMLLRLPGMTDDVAGAIVDWRDSDDNPQPSGAENSAYATLQYNCKNSPFETVEELLLVRGATPELLYGDGSAPAAGSGSTMMAGTSGNGMFNDPQLARGLYDLLTIYSRQPNRAADGTRRVNVTQRNTATRSQLRSMLRSKLGRTDGDRIYTRIATTNLLDVFDLYLRSQMTPDQFARVADYLTSDGGNQVRGTVNVNTAPRDVLLCLPGLETVDVDKLIAQRPPPGGSDSESFAWVANALGAKSRGLGRWITGHSTRYSADILAVSGNGRAYKRCRIVVDTAGDSPRVLYRRDLTDRGWPMDPQILGSIRAGQAPAGSAFGTGGALR